ncbi:hypothetical protein GF354_01665 [Candidatus Peregrinibacteria bacterium]|nr:hypothetical protein [Candidatus Peregrinibacteria bacterium]
MSVLNAYSKKKDTVNAVNEIKENFKDGENKLILFFASSNYPKNKVAEEMKNAFPDSKIFGCTTAGEITSGQLLKSSLVAMSFDSEEIEDVEIAVIENISNEDNVASALIGLEKYYGKRLKEMDYEKYVGVILFDGLSNSEEKIMEKIGDHTDLTVIGGSAGDDVKFEETFVFADGKTYNNAAVLALIKTKRGFDTIKTQSFDVLDKEFTVTKVDESNRRKVLEINNEPAVEYYAKLVGTDKEDAQNHFMDNPTGLMVNGEPYVRSPQRIEGNAICFYCQVKEGTSLKLLKATDIISETKTAITRKLTEIGSISALINFHCILRTLQLEDEGKEDEYGEIFKDIPTIGFSTYGEEYIGHINQSSTMLVFK